VRDGDITELDARVLAEATVPLDDPTTTEVEALVLPGAAGQTRAEFRRAVHREVTRLDARAVEERHRDAIAERRVVCTPGADGMAERSALLPADAATSLMTALDALAAPPRRRRRGRCGRGGCGVLARSTPHRPGRRRAIHPCSA
jgi:Domain of unknown function (DUF222)